MEKIDQYMAVEAEKAGTEVFFSADDPRFILDGFYWRSPGGAFRRLPQSSALPSKVDILANEATGGLLRFRTDAAKIQIRVRARVINNNADIMTYSRVGFDLYCDNVYSAVSRLNFDEIGFPECEYVATLLDNPESDCVMHDYKLHFPLYAEVLDFGIGFNEGAAFGKPAPWADERPIVLYGTSIEHGCCASRPGLSLSNILSRRLNMPVLNYGFAGSGRGEASVAEMLASIRDPRLYIVSYDANVSPAQLGTTLPAFVKILREAHPHVPVLSVSHLAFPREKPDSEFHRLFTRTHRNAGTDFLDGLSVLGADYPECYIDTVHPNDLGMRRFADALEKKVREILAK